jgi:hypothetical protein
MKLQSKIKVGCREVAKIKEVFEMRHMREATKLVFRDAGVGSVIRGLAIGVLLVAGTGMYFRMSADDAVVNPTASQREAVLKWQLSHLPGIDRLDDQIAAGLEADFPAYRSVLAEYVDTPSNPTARK